MAYSIYNKDNDIYNTKSVYDIKSIYDLKKMPKYTYSPRKPKKQIQKKVLNDIGKIKNKRSILDRLLSPPLMVNYAIAGTAKGFVDNKSSNDITPLEGFVGGIRAGNPFGKGYERGKITFSDVLESAGWEPKSTTGKISKGVVGFALDVFLDITTYVSGGLGALVKGTGKLGKLAKGAIKMDDAIDVVSAINKSKKLNMSADDVQRHAKLVCDLYKEIGGLERQARDLTLSLGNAPFGNKIFGKRAEKVKVLADAKKIQELGDKTIAPYYAKLRDQIYGGKFGKLFSTKSSLYKLAQENPAKLYDLIRYAERTRELGLEKHVMKKKIYEKGKELANLTPDENKQLLELMQDKIKWRSIQKTLKFIDTQDGKRYYNMIKRKRHETQQELDKLIKMKDNIDKLMKQGEGNLAEAQKELDALRKEYRVNLEKLNISDMVDEKQVNQTIKMYKDELDSILKEEVELEKSYAEKALSNYEAYLNRKKENKKIVDAYNVLKDTEIEDYNILKGRLIKAQKQYNKALESGNVDAILEANDKVLELRKLIDERKDIREFISQEGRIDTKKIKLPDEKFSGFREDAIKNLSQYLYGVDNMIDAGVYEKELQAVLKMLRNGSSKEEILKYIDKNADIFSGKLPIINTFVAKEIGYKTWKDKNKSFTEELKKLQGKTDAKSIARIKEIKNIRAKRKELRSMFENAKTKEEVVEIINNYHKKHFAEDIIDDIYERKAKAYRATRYDNDRARYKIKNTISGERFTNDDISEITSRVLQKDNTDKSLVNEVIEIIDEKLKREYNGMPFSKLKDTPSRDAVTGKLKKTTQRNYIVDEAIAEAHLRRFEKTSTPKQKRVLKKEVVKEVEKRTEKDRIQTVKGFVKPGMEISFEDTDWATHAVFKKDTINKIRKLQIGYNGHEAVVLKAKRKRGVPLTPDEKMMLDEYQKTELKVEFLKSKMDKPPKKVLRTGVVKGHSTEEGIFALAVECVDGKTYRVYPSNITGVKNTGAKEFKSIEEAMEASKIVEDAINRKDELIELIEKEKAKLVDRSDITKLTEKYKQRAERVKKNIIDLEKTQATLRKAMQGDDIAKIDVLTDKIKKMDKVLNNEEAFETYAKTNLGAKYGRVGEYVFEGDLNVSEKIAKIAEALRKEFIQFGKEEVKLKKLDEKQFETLMYNYLPHVLTPEGAKYLYLKSDKPIKKGVSFGDMYGFGKKSFNLYAIRRKIKYLPKKIDEITGKVLEWYENPTIEQINEFFRPMLKGKNFFSENIADIYIARAIKHTDLLYDNEYMLTMMNEFGKRIGKEGMEKGNKAVANFGLLRKHVYDKAMTMAKKEAMGNKELLEMAFKKNVDVVLDSYKLPKDILTDMAIPMVELNAEQVKLLNNTDLVRQVNSVIVDKANQARKIQIAKDQSDFLKLYDKITYLVKLNQTAVMPNFHARNKVSNIFNNALIVGKDAMDPELQKLSWKTVRAHGDVGDIKEVIKIKQSDGTIKTLGWDEAYDLAKQYGVIDEGYYAKDIGWYKKTPGILSGVSPKFDPTDTENFILYKKGKEFGSMVENSDRFVHFVAQLKNGQSADMAAKSVNKALFDYSDLTAFEQNVMKRIIPYYTWIRKNVPLQLDMIIEQPEIYQMIAKIISGIEHSVPSDERISKRRLDDFAKDWVQTPFTVADKRGQKKPILFNPNLPYDDVTNIPDPTQPINYLKDVFAQANPMVKVPIEQLINRNVFFESPIVRKGDSQLLKRTDHILSQLAPYSALRGFANKQGADLGLHTLNQLIGLKMLSLNYNTYKRIRMKEILNELNEQ